MTTTPTRPGRWKAGESGNPAGRRPGSGEVARLRTAIAEHVPSLIQTLIDRALAGDVGAARLLLERVLPALRPVDESVIMKMPDGSLTDQGRVVLSAVADGGITPSQGAVMLGAISTLGKLVETDELVRRIEMLEANGAKP